MTAKRRSFAEQSAVVLLKAFFVSVKTLFVLLALTVGALVAGQTSAAADVLRRRICRGYF